MLQREHQEKPSRVSRSGKGNSKCTKSMEGEIPQGFCPLFHHSLKLQSKVACASDSGWQQKPAGVKTQGAEHYPSFSTATDLRPWGKSTLLFSLSFPFRCLTLVGSFWLENQKKELTELESLQMTERKDPRKVNP